MRRNGASSSQIVRNMAGYIRYVRRRRHSSQQKRCHDCDTLKKVVLSSCIVKKARNHEPGRILAAAARGGGSRRRRGVFRPEALHGAGAGGLLAGRTAGGDANPASPGGAG